MNKAGEPNIRFALISVSGKTGVEEFARGLAVLGIGLISTGGTAALLANAGLSVVTVEAVTGFPEILDGRVKTLHPRIHAGLLAARDNEAHAEALALHSIAEIGLLAVDLYPFEATVESGANFDECIEKIDVGGPALIRAAAKNHDRVTVLTDKADYARVLDAITASGGSTPLSLRRELAAKAFARCAAYDAAIATWFARRNGEHFPARMVVCGARLHTLSYGENPHQRAALYASGPQRDGVATARLAQGKPLSYNNINDADAAYELACEFDPAIPMTVIVKHANPCGAAHGVSLAESYQRALACDPQSAFGGVIAMNRPIDDETAAEIVKIFTELVIAPGASLKALAILAAKKNIRVLLTQSIARPEQDELTIRSVAGGFLAQTRDVKTIDELDLKVMTERAPTPAEWADLRFAFCICKHVKSNAIVYVKEGATVGIGAGQMSRVDSARIAFWKAQEAARAASLAEPLTKGSVVASDAFFPFADGLDAAAEAGATAVIQPGGSINDAEVIAAANARGLAMVFTGVRHFRH
jgi:phosphoribosylaminoimidazolecarboxamide formyltransferase/IMP cyclohydrolase